MAAAAPGEPQRGEAGPGWVRARRLLGSGGRWEEEEESKLPFPGAAGEPPPTQCPRGAPPARRGVPGVGQGSAGGRGARGIAPFLRLGASLPRFVCSPAARLAPAVPGAGLSRRPALEESEDLPRQLLVVLLLLPPKLPGIAPAPLRVCGRAGGWAVGRNAIPKCCHLPAHPRRGCAAAGGRPCARGRAARPSPRPQASPGDPPWGAVQSFSCPSSPPGRGAHAWLSLYNCGAASRG